MANTADTLRKLKKSTAVWIPLDPDIYNQSDGGAGHIYVDYSATENIEVAALLFPGK